jgi:metal-responsive CopG/Arc/MetJ family transcriptional regulator
MDQITLRIPEDTLEEIEQEANEHGVSRSEYIRDVLESRENTGELQGEHKRDMGELRSEHEREIEELREEYENEIEYLQNQIDRLQRTNLKILEQREENTDLQVYVDERREWEQASWFTRQKWKLFGKD